MGTAAQAGGYTSEGEDQAPQIPAEPSSGPSGSGASENGTAGGFAPAPPPQTTRDASLDNQKIDAQPLKTPEPSWGEKVYHGVLNALGGSSDVSLARDPQTGKMVATAVKSGPGQQWKRIISGAIAGMGNAAANAGTGPGAKTRGLGLGIQAGEQQAEKGQQQQRQNANEDFEAQQKAATSSAQNALLSHQIAQSTFNLERGKIEASQGDMDRANAFGKLISDGGEASQDMGIFPDFKSVVAAFKEMPALHDHLAQGRMIAIPHIGDDGKIDGIHAALVTQDWLDGKITKDLPLTMKTMKDGKLTESTYTIPAGGISNGDASKLLMAQSKDALDEYDKQAKEKDDKEKLRLEASRTAHENRANDATADKEETDAANLRAMAAGGDAGTTLVDQIGTGRMPIKNLSYLAARKPELLAAVAQKYPGFDGSKIDGYVSAYHDFTSTKPGSAGAALNAGGTALGHLRELRALNTVESHIPHTPAWTAYQNKAATVATELAKFYGDATIPAIASIKDTLTSTLPGNRDKAITTQAQSMGDKLDSYETSWKNAAPSAAYEANMPDISPQAKEARAALDPKYHARRVAELTQNPEAPPKTGGTAGAPVKITPGERVATAADGTPLVVRGGQWVPAQH